MARRLRNSSLRDQKIAYTHLGGLVAVAVLAVVASLTDRLMVGGLALGVLIAVAAAEAMLHRRPRTTHYPREEAAERPCTTLLRTDIEPR